MNTLQDAVDAMVAALTLGDPRSAFSIFGQTMGHTDISKEEILSLAEAFADISSERIYLTSAMLLFGRLSDLVDRRRAWDTLAQRWPEHEGQRPGFEDFDFDNRYCLFRSRNWNEQGYPKRAPKVLVYPVIGIADEVFLGFRIFDTDIYRHGENLEDGWMSDGVIREKMFLSIEKELPKVARGAYREDWRTCPACGQLWWLQDSETCDCGG